MTTNEDGHTQEQHAEEAPPRPRLTEAAAEALDRAYERAQANYLRRTRAAASTTSDAPPTAGENGTSQKGA